jgi:energy-coupling factor transporter ATP-binding protein EcfA2
MSNGASLSEHGAKPPVALIAGPTASGKSDLAVRLALALRGRSKAAVVINATSLGLGGGPDPIQRAITQPGLLMLMQQRPAQRQRWEGQQRQGRQQPWRLACPSCP